MLLAFDEVAASTMNSDARVKCVKEVQILGRVSHPTR